MMIKRQDFWSHQLLFVTFVYRGGSRLIQMIIDRSMIALLFHVVGIAINKNVARYQSKDLECFWQIEMHVSGRRKVRRSNGGRDWNNSETRLLSFKVFFKLIANWTVIRKRREWLIVSFQILIAKKLLPFFLRSGNVLRDQAIETIPNQFWKMLTSFYTTIVVIFLATKNAMRYKCY